MTAASAPPALKTHQIEALQAILPPSAEVADMLRAWRGADARYWNGSLTPCWLTANIEAYGACIGSWNPETRTINLIPALWDAWTDTFDNHGLPTKIRARRLSDDPHSGVCHVITHEACHQAQSQLYRHLDAAKGPRGKWFDTSHRCPSWSRACEDVIQREELDLFVPVWHRSTGNTWNPWVPDSADWMTWRKVDPSDTFDGRQLASFDRSKCFGPSGLTLTQLIESIGFPTETNKGKTIDWTI